MALVCRSCGAPIFFIKTKAGASMPVNCLDIMTIVTVEGVTVRGYIPHWTTCTEPTKFRQKAKIEQKKEGG